MRISSAQRYDAGIETMQRRQQELLDLQQKMTSGKRVERPSDDPTAAARAERALAAIGHADAQARALEASRHAMSMTEAALGEAGELLQQARETVVAAGNASYGDVERAALAGKLRGLREQLLAIANRDDGAGSHLFSGQGAAEPPFVDAPGGVQYVGAAGAQRVDAGEPLPISADGRAAWLGASSGNGVFETRAQPGSASAWIDAGRVVDPTQLSGASYDVQFSVGAGGTTYSVLANGAPSTLANVPWQPGKAIGFDGIAVTVYGAPANGDGFRLVPSAPTLSVFDVMDRAIAYLDTPLQSGAQIAQGNAFALRDLDASMARLGAVRAAAGEALNRAERVGQRIDDDRLAAQTERSRAEDLDLVGAVSEFQSKQTGYDAALKTYAMVQRLSLFDYLRS